MNDVNEILKRQLLLMKFDSGVTLKENHEKVSGKRILSEAFELSENVKAILDGCDSRNNNEGRIVDDGTVIIVAKQYGLAFNSAGTNLEPFRSANTTVATTFSYSDLCRIRDWYPSTSGGNFFLAIDKDIDFNNEWQEVLDAFTAAKNRTGPAPAQQQQGQQQQGQIIANPESGSSVVGSQGWDMGKAMAKYPCLSGNDLAWRDVMNDQYGDVIKLNIGKTKEGGQIYGRLYLQDGYMNLWDPPYTRIGGENQYAVCKNNKLSFQIGKNTSMTDASTGKPQMESVNKFGKLIKEDIDLEVINAAGGVGGGGGGDSGEQKKPGEQKPPRKKPADNKVCINKVQNLLKELNPSFNVSGSMDANTLIEIMNKLNELEKSLTVKKDEVTSVEKTKILPTFDITEP